MMHRLILLFVLFLAVPAHAFEHTPEYCEFHMTFPEAPSTAKACNPEDDRDCYHATRFTRVYALDSALNINATCNKAEENMLERYSGEVMTFTLQTMSKGKVDDPHVGFNDHGIAKQAVLIGGRTAEDGSETVYMAQIWIGKESIFTIEGEVTGAANAEADALLGDIMGSIRHKSWAVATDQPVEKQEENQETTSVP
jgi:hypothetical protein